MKIVILGPAHPHRGGIAKFNEVLAASLMREGHDVRVAGFTLQYPSFLFPGTSQFTDAPAPEGLVISREVNSVCPLSWLRTGRRIARERPDLLIVRYWMPFMAPALGAICRRVRRNGHTRVVALTDNIVPHEKHCYDRPLTRYFLKSVDAVVYMSQQVGRELQEFRFRGPSAFSPHPVYDNYGEPVSRGEACRHLGLDPVCGYVMFFGFIRDYKGLDLLLEAWSLLKEKGITAGRRLLVAGEYYGNREKYESLIARLDIGDDVIVHDRYIDENEVRYYFSAADVVVQPYRTATQSGVTQVAYHFGVPMIVTDVGGLAEIVADGRDGFVTGVSSEAIAAAVESFYADPSLEGQMRSWIAEDRARFGWDKLTGVFTKFTGNHAD